MAKPVTKRTFPFDNMRLRFLFAFVFLSLTVTGWTANQRKYINPGEVVKAFSDSLGSSTFIKNRDSLIAKETSRDSLLDVFIASYNKQYRINQPDSLRSRMADTLYVRIEIWKQEKAAEDAALMKNWFKAIGSFCADHCGQIKKYGIWIAVAIVLLVLFLIIRAVRRKREATRPTFQPVQQKQEEQPEIIVRRKTTSILKKQSLDDVLHNESYLRIDADEFCRDSAVRRLYLKNTCIKDIYNLYAEDLRNPENPKEDGCMVLGRWVYDNETDEYYVSLEQVVLPGDDAVFQEYELNFGGKIKLRVAECLRKLRRDTDMQYDLTCWVHSHPGLGVFFSNSDNGVHLQLKHATHPRFLTAMVIDILTPDMELGIFTFKHNPELEVNSKQDLTRMYSLEEMYKWAVSSERNAVKPDDYYDLLSGAEERDEACDGIKLNNGAIIDISQIVVEHTSGVIGAVCGYPHSHGIHTEYIIEKISSDTSLNSDMQGCFVVGSHLSIPSLQKAVASLDKAVHFVLFYSAAQQTVTAIPMAGGSFVMNEKYYGEESLENLKIWTRRKR